MRHLLQKLIAGRDLALDVGTANIRLYAQGKGLIAQTPSFLPSSSQESEISPSFPLTGGVVTDIAGITSLLSPLFENGKRFKVIPSRVLVCSPTDASSKEKEALLQAVKQAGAVKTRMIPEPLAAAVGMNLDLTSPFSQMVIDIGDGVTDMAILQEGQIVWAKALRKGCGDLHRAVQKWFETHYDLKVSYWNSEKTTLETSLSYQSNETKMVTVSGYEKSNQSRLTLSVPSLEIWNVLNPIALEIIQFIRGQIHSLPAELAVDIIDDGLTLTGGGACLQGMSELIAKMTHLEVKVATHPLHSVIHGAGDILSAGDRTCLWDDEES